MIACVLMGNQRLGVLALLVCLLSLTLPAQTAFAQGYLDVIALHAPESVIVGALLLGRKRVKTPPASNVFCTECGAENLPTNEFCGRCGKRLVGSPTSLK
jgi:hypothetical protein